MSSPSPPTARRSLAVVLVHYHGPELVREAWQALQEDAASSGIELEGVVIDNGSTPEERRRAAELPIRWVEVGTNLGYAGGANLGLRETRAEQAVLLNPDVRVLPGCLAALVEALDRGAAVAGPTFFWDRPQGFRLPPTERRTRGAELLRLLAERSIGALRARRRWRSHAQGHWTATETHESFELSGALLAFRREIWQRHPFDEGYPLYYEETDWLLRLRNAGEKAVHVPQAAALHGYARSTRDEPRAREWFGISEHRFRERHYGRTFTWLLERLGERWPSKGLGQAEVAQTPTRSMGTIEGPGPIPLPRDSSTPAESARPADGRIAWLELSATPSGFPAAGLKVRDPEDLQLSEDLWQILMPGTYFLRALDSEGRLVAEGTIVR